MNLIDVIILGIVEGVTEFLPISSTGHLMLASAWLKLTETDFVKTFQIFIQLGAIMSVVCLYGRTLLTKVEVWKKVLVAFAPAVFFGLLFYPFIKAVLLESTQVVLWALFLGGIVLIVFDLLHKESANSLDNIEAMPYTTALGIGLFQILAFIPGVSRAAATIIGGLVLGMKRRTIVEFSFLLAVPTMLAATGLDLAQSAHAFSFDQFVFLAVGFVVSFVVATLSIKFLLHFIQHHNFIPFGIYRILIAGLFFILLRPA